MKKRIFLMMAFALCTAMCFAEEPVTESAKRKAITGFSGGMMIHTGWASGTQQLGANNYNARGMVYGIGGALRLHSGKYLRFGTEGYTSNLPQKNRPLASSGSYLKASWGGLLIDGCYPIGRFTPYAGVTVVCGGHRTLLYEGDDRGAVQGTAFLRKGMFVGFDPFIGCDFAVTDVMRLTLKIDCLQGWGVGKTAGVRLPIGPRIFFGFMFTH
jgi:hypothetical protein